MTPKGCQQAAGVGHKTKTFLARLGYTNPSYTFVVSPHFRTLQTAAYFQYELTQTADTPLLLNSSIVVKAGPSAWKSAGGAPFANGAFAKLAPEVL